MKASRDFPYLNKIPGLERTDVTTKDFVPRSGRTLLAWGLGFFAVAVASAFTAWGGLVGPQAALLFKVFFVLFAALGLISFMARFVGSPTA